MQTQRSSVLQNCLYHGEMKTCFYVFPGEKKTIVSTKYFQIQFILALVLSGRIWEIIQNLHSDSEKYTEGFPRENFRGLD